MTTRSKPLNDPFHRHLDECQQCAANPFGMCPTGTRLLQQQVAEIDAQDERDEWFNNGDPAEP